MDMQMVHRRVSMDAREDFRIPVPSRRQLGGRTIPLEGGITGPLEGGVFSQSPLQLLGGQRFEGPHFFLDGGEEGGVVEGVEGVEELFAGVPREEEEVQGGFREEVVDGDEGGGVVDYARGGEGFWGGGVGFEAVAAEEGRCAGGVGKRGFFWWGFSGGWLVGRHEICDWRGGELAEGEGSGPVEGVHAVRFCGGEWVDWRGRVVLAISSPAAAAAASGVEDMWAGILMSLIGILGRDKA